MNEKSIEREISSTQKTVQEYNTKIANANNDIQDLERLLEACLDFKSRFTRDNDIRVNMINQTKRVGVNVKTADMYAEIMKSKLNHSGYYGILELANETIAKIRYKIDERKEYIENCKNAVDSNNSVIKKLTSTLKVLKAEAAE